MKVWQGEVDTVVAEDLADVREVLVNLYGDSDEVTEMMNDGFAEVADDKSITIHNIEDDPRSRLTLTAAEWIAREGRGLLCSTEF
jgi:hypothetical protein